VHALMMWCGRLAGAIGVLMTAVAVATRLGGAYQLGDYQAITLLQAGVAAMVLGCLAYVAAMAERRSV
jgi:phytoene/squalene synthetase